MNIIQVYNKHNIERGIEIAKRFFFKRIKSENK